MRIIGVRQIILFDLLSFMTVKHPVLKQLFCRNTIFFGKRAFQSNPDTSKIEAEFNRALCIYFSRTLIDEPYVCTNLDLSRLLLFHPLDAHGWL